MKKIVLLAFALVLLSTLTYNIQLVNSYWTWTETIYIRADGSVEPDTAPITSVDNITYTLTDNIVGGVPAYSSAIVVERNNIVIDGAGYTLQNLGTSSKGIELDGRSNVTIKNMEVKTFKHGIFLQNSSNNIITGNHITANSWAGIWLSVASNNVIYGNNITNNLYGIYLGITSNNIIYHNNFINNTGYQANVMTGYYNIWDNGYPSGGNYWSDYEESYPDAIEIDESGIWNTPYEILHNNQDNYPLIEIIPEFPTWTSTLFILIMLTVAITIYKRRLLKTPIH